MGEKKNYDDPSSDSFSVCFFFLLFLTTLKNRWTLFLIRRDTSLIRTFPTFLSFRDYFRLHFHSLSSRFATTVVCRPNHRRKNVTPRSSLMIYICTYAYIYTCLYIGKRSRSKIFFVFFSFALSVTSCYTGRAG